MKKISKSKIEKYIGDLLKDYAVFAPVDDDGINSFKEINEISSVDKINFHYSNSKKPPKEIFFPQSEVLMKFKGSKVESVDGEDSKERIIFGMRPCDANSMLLLDNVFYTEKYKDVYYAHKRDHTAIIGLACNEPQPTCFCTSFDENGPFSRNGMDLLFIDNGDSYLVEIATEKGKKLITDDFEEADQKDVQQADKLKEEAINRIESKVSIEGVKEKLEQLYDSDFWNSLYEKCLGCGVCTYLCPTCHCFDIVDEALDSEGKRVRNWDSCMFPLFTLEASGHNPRPTGRERMRQRVMHKFNYFIDNYGAAACVGCGRCIVNCPVNIDVRKVIYDVHQY